MIGGLDSIFDDDVEDVGSEIEAYCPSPRCKADTQHTIISKYEDEVRRVQCVVCGDVHAYRKPRGDPYDEPIDPPQRKAQRKPTWKEAMARVTPQEMAACRPYSIRDTYREGDIVFHPKFQAGFVTELLPDNKLEITFRAERRILVHNRDDLATKMPAVADIPVPRNDKRRAKRRKGVEDRLARWTTAPTPTGKLTEEELRAKEEIAELAAHEKQALTPAAEPPAPERKRASKSKATASQAKSPSRATAAKQSTAKKSKAKPSTAKPSTKKSTAKPSTAKKATAKKPAAKKTTAKKSAATKATAKKATAKKPAGKKATAKKTTAKKPAAKKKTTAKKSAATKATAKKATAKKATAKKPAGKKATAKKPAGKKTAAKKPAGRKR